MEPQPAKISDRLKFGEDCELDIAAGELRRSGRLLKLERIPMELLILLIDQRGRLVDRQQIVEKIWGKDVFLDTDNSINAAVRKIRQVLRDDPANPRFVQTVTGRGYRFIATVRTEDAPAAVVEPDSPPLKEDEKPGHAGDPLPQDHDTTSRPRSIARLHRWMVGAAIAIVLLAGLATYIGWSRLRSRHQAPVARVVLAVLPFENLTGDSSEDYFSDGMTEEMIAQVGRLDPQHLGVIARTSVMFYKHSNKPLEQIGRELGAQYVLEGSVRRDSDKVRITAQLIQMKDQTHLWSHQYDRSLSNLLALEGEIAQEIADEIQVTLGDNSKNSEAPRKPELSPEQFGAYDLYLKGQYFLNKRSGEGFLQAIHYYQQAIARNPNYAPAYAGLADAYALLGGYSGEPQTEFMAKARAAAVRALELDDTLAEGHTALALVVQNYDWDWQTAEKEYRRAIELNPNYSTAHHWYAEHLAFLGRFDEALRESEQARRLDPLSLIIAADHAVILYYARRYDDAIRELQAVMDMDPAFSRAGIIVHAYVQKGLIAPALALSEKRRPAGGDTIWFLSEEANLYGRAGRPAEARRALARLLELNRRQPIDAGAVIWAYLGIGDKEQAFTWLEKAYTQHSNSLTTLKVEPGFDPLRNDPRFQDLMRRVGLSEDPGAK